MKENPENTAPSVPIPAARTSTSKARTASLPSRSDIRAPGLALPARMPGRPAVPVRPADGPRRRRDVPAPDAARVAAGLAASPPRRRLAGGIDDLDRALHLERLRCGGRGRRRAVAGDG